jgi:hypothetical protein
VAWQGLSSIPTDGTRVLLDNVHSDLGGESWPKIGYWRDGFLWLSDRPDRFPLPGKIGSPTHWRKLDRVASPLSGGDTGKVEVTDAARDVLAERLRQVEAEGWTPKHDDTHRRGELAMAAACYAVGDQIRGKDAIEETATVKAARWRYWPWADEWWKPADRRRNLVKAGALILAEIERLDRAALRTLEGKRT